MRACVALTGDFLHNVSGNPASGVAVGHASARPAIRFPYHCLKLKDLRKHAGRVVVGCLRAQSPPFCSFPRFVGYAIPPFAERPAQSFIVTDPPRVAKANALYCWFWAATRSGTIAAASNIVAVT